MLLYTKHAEAMAASTACGSSVDADVAIYVLYFVLQISIPMYIRICTSDRRRCMNIQNIINEIREEVFLVLSALHSFTGNYSTSAFYGNG